MATPALSTVSASRSTWPPPELPRRRCHLCWGSLGTGGFSPSHRVGWRQGHGPGGQGPGGRLAGVGQFWPQICTGLPTPPLPLAWPRSPESLPPRLCVFGMAVAPSHHVAKSLLFSLSPCQPSSPDMAAQESKCCREARAGCLREGRSGKLSHAEGLGPACPRAGGVHELTLGRAQKPSA